MDTEHNPISGPSPGPEKQVAGLAQNVESKKTVIAVPVSTDIVANRPIAPPEGQTLENPAEEADKPSIDQTRQGSKKRQVKSRERGNWLMGDPQGWIGRKVRSRRNLAIYAISEVYVTGRVKLERNWMTYLTDVQSVRTQYDTVC